LFVLTLQDTLLSAEMGPNLFIYLYLFIVLASAQYPIPSKVDLGQNVGWFAGPNDYDEEAGWRQ